MNIKGKGHHQSNTSKIKSCSTLLPISYIPIIPNNFTVIIDTREQNPYKFDDLNIPTVTKKLHSCDYSIQGFESSILIERKSQSDYYGSISEGRERFKAMWDRIDNKVEFKGLLIECTESELYTPELTFSGITKNSIYGTTNSLEVKYNIHTYINHREMCRIKLIHWLVKFFKEKRGIK